MTSTLRDESLMMFSAGIEDSLAHRLNIPEVDDAIMELEQTDTDDEENVDAGWALKRRKAVVRFTERAKRFIEQLFDEGIANKKKLSPEEAEKRMADAREGGVRIFSVDERLNARQIASYFSRIAAARENVGAEIVIPTTTPLPSRKRRVVRRHRSRRDETAEEEEDDIIDENAFFDDAGFVSDEDLVLRGIWDASSTSNKRSTLTNLRAPSRMS